MSDLNVLQAASVRVQAQEGRANVVNRIPNRFYTVPQFTYEAGSTISPKVIVVVAIATIFAITIITSLALRGSL